MLAACPEKHNLTTRERQDDLDTEELNEKISTIRRQLMELGVSTGPSIRRNITISVNILSDEHELALELSYVVSGASWQPAYDMRLDCAEQTMALVYYGLVTQSTGEDWNGCHISLSTATPAVSGHPPALPSKVVEIHRAPVAYRSRGAKKSKRGSNRRSDDNEEAMLCGSAVDDHHRLHDLMDDVDAEAPMLSVARDFEAGVKNSDLTGSSLFEIRREVFIQSDNKSHKVRRRTHVLDSDESNGR